MLTGLVDVRGKLRRNDQGGPKWSVPEDQKWGVVIHYNGPAVPASRSDLEQLRIDAEYHVTKDWDEDPHNGEVLKGDGLMYHIAIGRDGTCYQCRDLGAVLWHCGAWPQNRLALSVLVILGGDQRATPRQLASLTGLVNEWQALGRCDRTSVWGHQELSSTDCPGTLMADFVLPWRGGGGPMADGFWFNETKRFVGGAFWRYWRDNGGLMVFGYPLTDELQEDGRTVQYFERAVFEWHPKNAPSYQVLLRRLGAEALARGGGRASTTGAE